MPPASPIACVDIDGLRLLFWKHDVSFRLIMSDPRSRRLEEGWEQQSAPVAQVDLNLDVAWKFPGLELMDRVFIHYWRRGLDIAYFDVGAHVGLTVIPKAVLAKRAGRSLRAFALEPGPPFTLLRRSVHLNGVADYVTCLDLAASDVSGSQEFYILNDHMAGSSLVAASIAEHADLQKSTKTVGTSTLDDIAAAANVGQNLIVKIDTEGADFRVISGMKEMIRDRVVSIKMEFTPSVSSTYTDPVGELVKLGESFVLLHTPEPPGGVTHIEPYIDGISEFVDGVNGYTDLILLPRKLPGVIDLVAKLLS